MSCFSLGWLEQLLIYLVIVGAVIAILRLLIPWITSFLGMPILGQALEIVLWAVIAIIIIYIIFALLSCLVGGGTTLGFPKLGR